MKLHSLLAAFMVAASTGAEGQSVALHHIHGLAYSADGKRLMIPSHPGLALFENGKWSMAPQAPQDYMGFAASAKNLYTSGHPAPGASGPHNIGLLRSRDGGKTWDKLGLEGEGDFHLLATGWNTNAIYLWNPAPNSRMKRPGLHYTVNDGFAWRPAAAAGLSGQPRAVAVHPDDPATVALATSDGLYLSGDSGERFTRTASGGEGVSAFFDLDGKFIWYGSYEGQARLQRIPLKGTQAVRVPLPPLTKDAVAFIAQNPARRLEYAIATFERSVYLSNDPGQSWKQIAERGQSK